MDGAGAGGAAPERRKQLTAAEAVNHKRQLAQMVERELALTGADSVTDFDDALQMVLVETAFGRYPKHLLDVYTGKVVGRQERERPKGKKLFLELGRASSRSSRRFFSGCLKMASSRRSSAVCFFNSASLTDVDR